MLDGLGPPDTWGDDTLRIVSTLGCLVGLGGSYILAWTVDKVRSRSTQYWTVHRIRYFWRPRR